MAVQDQSTIELRLTLNDKDFAGKMQVANEAIKGTKSEVGSVSSKLAEWGMIMTGFNQTIQLAHEVMNTFKQDIMSGTQEDVLRSLFKGTAEDMELFKKAVAGTVDDGGLLKLSNYATDLGIEIKQQPLLFNLAKQASEKYGTSTEEGFDKIILASEGSTRAIKSLGIEGKLYIQVVNEMAEAHGKKMAELDSETQKQIRLDAILKASKVTMDDVINQRQNDHDKIVAEGVVIKEAQDRFGSFIAGALMPLITGLKEAGAVGDGLIGTISISSSVITGLLPILLQYRISQSLVKTETIATTAAIEGETAAFALSSSAMLGIVSVLGVLVLASAGLENAMEAVRKKMLDSTFKNWIDETSSAINKMDEATAKWTKADNDRQKAMNDAKIKNYQENIPGTQFQNIDQEGNATDRSDTDATKTLRDNIASLELQNRKLLEANKLIENKLNPTQDTKNVSVVPAESEEKTYEQKVKDYLVYYEGLANYDKKYQQQYEDYLNEQNTYYTETLLKKRGSMEEYSNDEISMMNEIKKQSKKFLDDKIKAEEESQKLISKSRTDSMIDGFEKDSQVIDDWLEEEMKKEINGVNLYKTNAGYRANIDQQYFNKKEVLFDKEIQKELDGEKKLAQAKLDAMSEGSGKDKASIDKQFVEDKSLAINNKNIYETDATYKLAIDEKYYKARLELAKKDMVDRNVVNQAMLSGYDTFMGNVLRTDMTGAEKKMAILENVKNFLWQKLTEELKDVIITETAKTLIHTGAEASKTTATGIGVGARIALIGMEIVATLAAAAAAMVHAVASIFEWQLATFGPFALFTIPASIAAMVGIYTAAKSAFGYDRGGLLKKGERGYFEGNRDEIIAPKDTFIDVVNQTIIPRVMGEHPLHVTNLLERGRDMITLAFLNANNSLRVQGDSMRPDSGGSKKMDQLIRLTEDNLRKHDQVISAFENKQFEIDLWALRTQQKKIDAIYDKLAIR